MILRSTTWGECIDSDSDRSTDVAAICSTLSTAESDSHQQQRRSRHQSLKSSLNLNAPTLYNAAMDSLKGSGGDLQPAYHNHSCANVDWSCLPQSVHPSGGGLPASRVWRKEIQVQNMLYPCISLIESLSRLRASRPITVVEFCAGSGYIVLPLAALYPHHRFVLIDAKAASVAIGRQRIRDANLLNIDVVEGLIEAFDEPFDIGISLHACGGATDVVLQSCVKASAAFVSCSCCIGKILFYRSKPLSLSYCHILSEVAFKALVKAADFGHSDLANYSCSEKSRRLCKCFVEKDRCLFAEDHGYRVRMLLMHPREASPKNDILVGWPSTFDSRCASDGSMQTAIPMGSIFSTFNDIELKMLDYAISQRLHLDLVSVNIENFLFHPSQ